HDESDSVEFMPEPGTTDPGWTAGRGSLVRRGYPAARSDNAVIDPIGGKVGAITTPTCKSQLPAPQARHDGFEERLLSHRSQRKSKCAQEGWQSLSGFGACMHLPVVGDGESPR